MNFRYFDSEGRQLTWEQLRSLCVSTPVMSHIFATVAERMEKDGKPIRRIENGPPK